MKKNFQYSLMTHRFVWEISVIFQYNLVLMFLFNIYAPEKNSKWLIFPLFPRKLFETAWFIR